MKTLQLKTLPKYARGYDYSCRDYFKGVENGYLYVRYHDAPHEIMTAIKSIGEPDTPLKHGLRIIIDGGVEEFDNFNKFYEE